MAETDPWAAAMAAYQQALVDLNGDGVPDAVIRMPQGNVTSQPPAEDMRPYRIGDQRRPMGLPRAQTPGADVPMPSRQDNAEALGQLGLMAAGGPLTSAALKLGPAALGVLAGSAATLMPSEVNSQAAMTKAQQRQLEYQDRQKKADDESAARRAQTEVDAEIRRKKAADDQELNRQRLERKLQEEIATEERNKTFQQKYGPAADMLPVVGLAAGLSLPYAGKAVGQWIKSGPVRNMNRAVAEADRAAVRGDAARISDMTPRLANYADDVAQGAIGAPTSKMGSVGAHLGAGLTGGLAAAEATMYPELWNYQNLPDGPRKQQAHDEIYNWRNYVERGLIGAATGVGGLHIPVMKATPRTQDALGIVEKYGTTPQSAVRAIERGRLAPQPGPTSGGPAPQPSPVGPGGPAQPVNQLLAAAAGPNRRGPMPLTVPEENELRLLLNRLLIGQ